VCVCVCAHCGGTKRHKWHSYVCKGVTKSDGFVTKSDGFVTKSDGFYSIPPEKLLADGLSTPVPLFSLICTIISNKTSFLD